VTHFLLLLTWRNSAPSLPTKPPRPLPFALKVAGSVFAVAHLTAILLLVLEPESGPWAYYGGETPMLGPTFASAISGNMTRPYYLDPLRMISTYHFTSNRPAPYAVYFEVILKDELGGVQTLKFPDDKANFWVRHRQEILARSLAEDLPVPPARITEVIPAPGKEVPTLEIWEMSEPGVLHLKNVPEDKVPRNPPAIRPSEGAKLFAQAYMRHLCREHKAKSAELIRHSRATVTPTDMFNAGPRGPDFFNELRSYFGEYPREK
jgi:hypothetical protein